MSLVCKHIFVSSDIVFEAEPIRHSLSFGAERNLRGKKLREKGNDGQDMGTRAQLLGTSWNATCIDGRQNTLPSHFKSIRWHQKWGKRKRIEIRLRTQWRNEWVKVPLLFCRCSAKMTNLEWSGWAHRPNWVVKPSPKDKKLIRNEVLCELFDGGGRCYFNRWRNWPGVWDNILGNLYRFYYNGMLLSDFRSQSTSGARSEIMLFNFRFIFYFQGVYLVLV